MDKDKFITLIECEFCNNIKITNTTFYIINILLIVSLILNCINYAKSYNINILYLNDSIYKDNDKDDDSQFINTTNNNDLNSSFEYDDNSSFDDD
jgi:hypothetical protein